MATAFEMSTPELIVREVAPESGAQIYQLTSCPAINSNIYGEVPYMDAASRYVMYLRRHDSVGPAHLWRADLERRLVTKVAESDRGMRGFGRRTKRPSGTSTSGVTRRTRSCARTSRRWRRPAGRSRGVPSRGRWGL